MYTIILFGHITIAVLTLAATAGAAFATYKASYSAAKTGLVATWASLALTTVSGLGLAVIAPNVIGRMCLSMTITIVSVAVVQLYYRRQIQLSSAL